MQKCDFQFEIVVHDDFSTDGTASIIREYKEKYPHLFRTILQTENKYSQGVDIWGMLFRDPLTAPFIAICEGDDYWIDPLKLQKQIDFLEKNQDYAMCFHNAINYYDSENRNVRLFNESCNDCDLTVHDAIHKWVVPTASIVGRKTFLSVYPEWLSRIYSSDYSLILIMIHLGKIRYLDGIMSVYRITTSGSSATALMKKRNIFMLEQKIMLLESYDIGTNRVYTEEVNSRIKYLKQELRFQKAKEKNNLLFLVFMPKMLLSKLLKKAKQIYK